MTSLRPNNPAGGAPDGPELIVLSCSPQDDSVSRTVLKRLCLEASDRGLGVELVDVRELPICMAGLEDARYPSCWAELKQKVEQADALVLGAPVHRAAVSGATRNVLEMLLNSLAAKPVAVVVGVGSHRSHLAAQSLLSDLRFGFRAEVLDTMIVVSKDDLSGDDLVARVIELVDDLAAHVTKSATLVKT